MSTVFVGICDYCRVIRQFGTAEERDAWEANHEHEGGANERQDRY